MGMFTSALVLTMPDAPKDQCINSCAFLSRKVSPTGHNYDVGNWELLAIKVALEAGSQYTKPDALSRLYDPEPAAKEPEPILPPDRVVGA
ncbi:hypothetical protein L3Q82_019136, partial [Scortum barcoo]